MPRKNIVPKGLDPSLHERGADGRVRFAKGHKQLGGLKKGQKHVNADTRALIKAFVHENWAEAEAIYARVKKSNPRWALDLLIKATEYVEPKLSRADVTSDGKPVAVAFLRYGPEAAPPPPPVRDAPDETADAAARRERLALPSLPDTRPDYEHHEE